MDLDTELNLNEVAMRLGVADEKLIRLAARNKFTISVMADEWNVVTDKGTTTVFTGLANLLPEDLKLSYTSDITRIRKIATADNGEVLALEQPVELRRGKLLVAPEEFRRFRRKYGGRVGLAEDSPPYLDSGHGWYSTQLALAVQAWMALFSDGNFDRAGKSAKHHIRKWLAKNAANLPSGTRENIAKLVNPDEEKLGGAPQTPVK